MPEPNVLTSWAHTTFCVCYQFHRLYTYAYRTYSEINPKGGRQKANNKGPNLSGCGLKQTQKGVSKTQATKQILIPGVVLKQLQKGVSKRQATNVHLCRGSEPNRNNYGSVTARWVGR